MCSILVEPFCCKKHSPGTSRSISSCRSLHKAAAQGDIVDATFVLLWIAGDFISYAVVISAWAIGLASSYWLLFSERVATAYLGVLLTHAMVHLEPRQVAGVVGIPLFLAICFWHRLAEYFSDAP